MCKSPTVLHDGTETACHRCSICIERAVDDWCGRNIAESKTVVASNAITLTYGRGRFNEVLHERAVLLTYSDVQKFFKLLRRHGYPVRYFVTGEFGSEKGRAHWHVIVHWLKAVPAICGRDQKGKWHDNAASLKRFNWQRIDDQKRPVFLQDGEPADWWPHGFVQVAGVEYEDVRYNCKYILKAMGDDERQGHLAMSKKPPLGHAYFRQLAEKFVEQGLSPQGVKYTFPEVKQKKKDGSSRPREFRLSGRSLELFLDQYIATWAKERPNQPRPISELVDLYQEWGRVVWDEDRVTANRVAWITERVMARGRDPLTLDGRDQRDVAFRLEKMWRNFATRKDMPSVGAYMRFFDRWHRMYCQYLSLGGQREPVLEAMADDAEWAFEHINGETDGET